MSAWVGRAGSTAGNARMNILLLSIVSSLTVRETVEWKYFISLGGVHSTFPCSVLAFQNVWFFEVNYFQVLQSGHLRLCSWSMIFCERKACTDTLSCVVGIPNVVHNAEHLALVCCVPLLYSHRSRGGWRAVYVFVQGLSSSSQIIWRPRFSCSHLPRLRRLSSLHCLHQQHRRQTGSASGRISRKDLWWRHGCLWKWKKMELTLRMCWRKRTAFGGSILNLLLFNRCTFQYLTTFSAYFMQITLFTAVEVSASFFHKNCW